MRRVYLTAIEKTPGITVLPELAKATKADPLKSKEKRSDMFEGDTEPRFERLRRCREGKYSRSIIFLIALVCVVQAVSGFEVIKEELKPDSSVLQPGQEVNAHYVISGKMVSTDQNNRFGEKLEFSTGLQKPTWDFNIRSGNYPRSILTREGAYQTLFGYEMGSTGDFQLEVQLRGTVSTTSFGKLEVVKIEHFRDKFVEDEYRMTRDVMISSQVMGILSVQQKNLQNLKADIDAKASQGVDVSAAQTKYNAASQALTSAAFENPSQVAEYITIAAKNMDEAKSLLDKAWAEKEVSNAAATIESLDGMITYFVENRSMGTDPQVVAIMTKRESAVQYYSLAKSSLSAGKHSLAHSKAVESINIANEALTDANALKERGSGWFNISGNPLYASVGIIVALVLPAGYYIRSRRNGRNTKHGWFKTQGAQPPDSPSSPLPSSIPHPVTPKGLPPEMTDRYTTSEYLGKGGFARVFKVQKPDGSWAALKIPISLDAATGKSFIAELQNWTSLIHENIVRINDYNIMPFPYFELELCDGTLATLERPIPPDHAAWLLFNVCEGLKYAHARGILHRDLKPQNIMLRDGVPKISDWGLSKVMTQSRTTTTSGGFTAYYAAPEQIANRAKDPRTDIWQLGVILYELVTGTLPFTGESMVEIGMAIATKTPERPGVVHPDAQPLDAIILKCLEKDPEQRYQSVAELQKDLAAYLKMNYAGSLKESVQANNLQRSAYYCGDLILISMKIGDLVAAYKYAADLARYSAGETKVQAAELAAQIKMRVEIGAQELPDELIRKAEVIVHQIRVR
ncbi:MAG: hypothetical protein CVV31_07170 [Methanomicrobiales archaeon HGW-Methanomicrobiales-2]|jgi:hypothetical protein|nr:MAG: hypothetical protein CVV31_07170 [Methanomicrobiales archaeon HGW-Methanomicrobiales-2]